MKIAIVTGASSGLGREFARQLISEYPEVEQLWLIARRRDRLEELAKSLPRPALCLALDLCDPMSFTVLQEKLLSEQPEVLLLVNNAGVGYWGKLGETETVLQTRMIDLNLRALTAVTSLTLPYVPRSGRILNVSSIAAFCPNARMTVYSSTKAFVSHFTVGLGEELRGRGISVTAVCPGPMATEFCDTGGITGNSKMFELLPYCDQVRVAHGALLAAKHRRSIYTPTAFYKFYRLAAKLTPMKLMAKLTKT
ncbi:SDR family NAD(P)-dependent oxidoreductase [Oscillibacter sp.]|uniref:SDR family NAD(P)-dependent oxidoreductase n=1 Tax=Oscillibacter sp. TaxID=1945593 RepID=UPI0028B03F08|nr:SDR family NAD(P)-dependent oxidoreductase [Oscillibacter sp.]